MMKTNSKTRGAAMLFFVLFFAFASTIMMFALNGSIFTDLADFNQLTRSKESYLVAEAIVEDVVYRTTMGTFSLNTIESVTLNGVTGTATTTYNSAEDEYVIEGKATKGSVERSSQAVMTIGAGSAFNYGLQAGNGGINLSNNSDIYGNVYSNGTVQGAGSAEVFGDIVSAGPSGLVADITATGSIFANTIDNIEAGMDAHYNVQIGTDAQNPVAGTRYTPATNQTSVEMPISTTTLQDWKDAITDYGTVITAADPLCSSGTYTIDTSITIGYLKVECDLDIRNTGSGVTVTLDGPIWVEGNVSFTQGPVIVADSSLGRLSAQIIADNPADRVNSSRIEVRNSTNFDGSGDSRSYIMLLSMNESSSLGGTVTAIDVSQSANGQILVYAAEGLIEIGNNIDLREVTGHQINVANGSSVTYESGLASLLFTSGPGGAYVLNDWQQIK